MKVLVDIKENKAAFILELLNSFGFVKTEVLTPEKEAIYSGVKEAVAELNDIKKGKKKSQSLKKFLDDL